MKQLINKIKLFMPISFILSLFMTCNVYASDYYVKNPGLGSQDCTDLINACPSIQQAIDIASDGDIIHVSSGTYTENITINKQLEVMGANANENGPEPRNNDESFIISTIEINSNNTEMNGLKYYSNKLINNGINTKLIYNIELIILVDFAKKNRKYL